MIEIGISAAGARLLRSEVLTSGRVGLRCRLHFDPAWDGLQKTAVLVGSSSVDLLLQEEEFSVPAECLERAGGSLKIGVYGSDGEGGRVIPTVWVNCGEILAGAEPSEQTAQEATPGLLAQIMDQTAQMSAIAARLREDAGRGVFNGRDGADGEQGPAGAAGADGATFTPSVSAAGVLSWTNDGGKSNPQSVDLVAAVLQALPSAVGVSF